LYFWTSHIRLKCDIFLKHHQNTSMYLKIILEGLFRKIELQKMVYVYKNFSGRLFWKLDFFIHRLDRRHLCASLVTLRRFWRRLEISAPPSPSISFYHPSEEGIFSFLGSDLLSSFRPVYGIYRIKMLKRRWNFREKKNSALSFIVGSLSYFPVFTSRFHCFSSPIITTLDYRNFVFQKVSRLFSNFF
jgi:hypothetical protein